MVRLGRYLKRDVDRQHFDLEARGEDTVKVVDAKIEAKAEQKAS